MSSMTRLLPNTSWMKCLTVGSLVPTWPSLLIQRRNR